MFDVDGVLINSFEANLKFNQDLMVRTGYPPPTKEQYQAMFHMTHMDVIRNITHSKDEQEIKRLWLMSRNEMKYPEDLITIPKNCRKTIMHLSKEYKLGIVTNRVTSVFSLKQMASLEKYFQTAVGFNDTDKHKPDAEPLLLACHQLRVSPDATVYIGDTNTDIIAAKAAGMKVIAFTKNKLEGADGITDSFDDIPKLIKNIGNTLE